MCFSMNLHHDKLTLFLLAVLFRDTILLHHQYLHPHLPSIMTSHQYHSKQFSYEHNTRSQPIFALSSAPHNDQPAMLLLPILFETIPYHYRRFPFCHPLTMTNQPLLSSTPRNCTSSLRICLLNSLSANQHYYS